MANRFFVNGGVDNNWGTAGNWSATSGGAGGAGVPGSGDDAFLDGNSPNCTVNSGGTRQCRQFDANGYTNTLTMNFLLTCNPNNTGIIRFAAGMTLAGSSEFKITAASSASITVTSAGKSFPFPVTFGGSGSTFTLADNWDINNTFMMEGASTVTVNGNQINVSGGLTVNGTAGKGGTTVIVLDGTGTWQTTSGAAHLASPLTINTAGTITVSGTVNYSGATLTYTAGTVVTTGSTLGIVVTGTTFNCASITWNNFSFTGNATTTTLSAALVGTGNLSVSQSGGSIATVNGSTLTFGGNLAVTGGHIAGTTELIANGSGTLSTTVAFSCTVRSSLTINTSGTMTVSGTFQYHTGTFKRTAGTIAGTSTPIINVNSGTATVFDFGGYDLAVPLQVNTAGVALNLASALGIAATGSLTLTGTAASPVVLKSNSTPTQRALTIASGALIDVVYGNLTDIDCSGGDKLWVTKGTLSNTTNIGNIQPYTSPLGAFVGGAPAAIGAFG